VYHAGAHVNYLFPYARLSAANVQGTHEVLRLAVTERLKRVHHVSTLGVFPPSLRGVPLRETEAPEEGASHPMAYARTKWAAEALALEARRRGVTVTIYRPADVGGATETGASNAADILCLTLQACVRVGAVPAIDREFNVAPVDYVARAIIEIAERAGQGGGIYHLSNPTPLRTTDVFAELGRIGYTLEPLPTDAWIALLRTVGERDRDASLGRVAALWAGMAPAAGDAHGDLAEWQYERSAAEAALAGTGCTCPPIDAPLLRTYVEHLVRSGALRAPAVA